MPFTVNSSATVAVEFSCSACGHRWIRTGSATHTSEPTWRRGVSGKARETRDVAESAAYQNASTTGHVCENCGRLSIQAVNTLFHDGFDKGLLDLYDRSLEEANPPKVIAGTFAFAFLGLWVPWVGGALAAVCFGLFVRDSLRIKECRRLRSTVANALAFLTVLPGRPLEEIAARCAMSGLGRHVGGSFQPGLSFCRELVSELRVRKLLTGDV